MMGDPLINPNRFNPEWTQFLKAGQVPWPANFFTFLEEHPDTINDGYFMNVWNDLKWGNLPASYHNGAANIAWADGHIERHRWLPEDRLRPAVQGGAGGGFIPCLTPIISGSGNGDARLQIQSPSSPAITADPTRSSRCDFWGDQA